MKNFVLTNLFSSFSFVFLFINPPLNWSFMFPFSWTVFSFVCVSMFCTFLIPWKNFHRMFPIFHNLGFLILVFAITKVLASLKQPSLFWETVICPLKPLLPQSLMWKTSIYVNYGRFWCFARGLTGFVNWRLFVVTMKIIKQILFLIWWNC